MIWIAASFVYLEAKRAVEGTANLLLSCPGAALFCEQSWPKVSLCSEFVKYFGHILAETKG